MNQLKKFQAGSASAANARSRHNARVTRYEVAAETVSQVATFIAYTLDEATLHLVRARANDMKRVPWSGPARLLLTTSEADAITQPNIQWAVWVIRSLLRLLLLLYLPISFFLNLPRFNKTAASIRIIIWVSATRLQYWRVCIAAEHKR